MKHQVIRPFILSNNVPPAILLVEQNGKFIMRTVCHDGEPTCDLRVITRSCDVFGSYGERKDKYIFVE